MICDGGCGSAINRGLWKCWNFKDLIWNYKYRTYRQSKDPSYRNEHHLEPDLNRMPSLPKQASKFDEDDEDRKDVYTCLVVMIESVVALAGESFLIQMYDLMMRTKVYLESNADTNGQSEDDSKETEIMITPQRSSDDDTHSDESGKGQKGSGSHGKKRSSLLGQNKYMEAFKV